MSSKKRWESGAEEGQALTEYIENNISQGLDNLSYHDAYASNPIFQQFKKGNFKQTFSRAVDRLKEAGIPGGPENKKGTWHNF